MADGPRNDELHDGNGNHRKVPPKPLEGHHLARWRHKLQEHLQAHRTDEYIAGLLADSCKAPGQAQPSLVLPPGWK